MLEIFQYEFMKRAIIATILTSIACGTIGVFIITKKIVSVTGGISHACFGGIGLSYYLGLDPLICLLPFSIFSALLLGMISKKTKISEDTAIGILWSIGVSIGVILIYLTPGYAPDLMTYLFGNILTVPTYDIYLIISVDVIIISFILLFYKEFLAMCFDEEFTEASGVPSNVLYMLLLCLIALTVVSMIKVVGIILIIAMLTIPASISSKLTYNVKYLMLLSCIIGIILSIFGLYISFKFNLPSGATIILIMGISYIIINLIINLELTNIYDILNK